MSRLAAQYVTAGGQTVDIRYDSEGYPVGGCTGCPATIGGGLRPVGECAAHEWAHAHALKCTSRPEPQTTTGTYTVRIHGKRGYKEIEFESREKALAHARTRWDLLDVKGPDGALVAELGLAGSFLVHDPRT